MTELLRKPALFPLGPSSLKQYPGFLPNFVQRATPGPRMPPKRVLLRKAKYLAEAQREDKMLKFFQYSLPPPPPFCPRHQNKRADTRVPMTLVYYQECAAHALLGHVVQPVLPRKSFPALTTKLRLQTHNPCRGQSLVWVP